MAKLSDEFRKRAADQSSASAGLFDEDDFTKNPKKQALAIIGQVNSTLYSALADMLDSPQRLTDVPDGIAARTEKAIARQKALRDAMAAGFNSGKWDEFDRLASGGDPNGTAPAAN